MRNILVTKFYTITDRFFLYNDMEKVQHRYAQARDILLASADKWLHDVDEVIVDTHTVKNDQEMFLHHTQRLEQLYNSEPCNILYCDLDIVFVKPTRVFGMFKDFSMCSGNCGVRYYPAGGMTDKQWNIQKEWVSNWKTDTDTVEEHIHNWQYEQDMYNVMHQSVMGRHKFINPFAPLVHNMYNIPSNDYTMVHCCGTSQQFDSVDLQKTLWEWSKTGNQDKIHTQLSHHLFSQRMSDKSPNNPWFTDDSDWP